MARSHSLDRYCTLAGRQRGLLTLNLLSVVLASLVLIFWSHDPIFAIVLAGFIGFARVIVMSVWLASGERASSILRPAY